MLTYIVTASINEVKNLRAINDEENEDVKIIVVDEGNEKVRIKNDEHLANIPHEHFGLKERENWFKSRFGSAFKRYASLVPERCHAETSFGFLVAYEENADVVLEIDDDVRTTKNFVKEHIENLSNEDSVTIHAKGKWYNTMENLVLNVNFPVYPRGHPYSSETRHEDYSWNEKRDKCVLNMGLWLECPDLGALTIVHYGGLDGRCDIKGRACKREKVVVGKGTYFAACSMNMAFKRQVIPAFYQLYMNALGVDRFDDIWSGLFLKKIADYLGEKMCIGKPLGTHVKRSRDVFEDLRKEMEGIAINEKLWRVVDEAELSSKGYADCYLELAEHLNKSIKKQFENSLHAKFMKLQIEKMRIWVDTLDKL